MAGRGVLARDADGYIRTGADLAGQGTAEGDGSIAIRQIHG